MNPGKRINRQNQSNRRKNGRRIAVRGLSLVLTLLTILEGIILAITIGVMVTELRDSDYNAFAEGHMSYRIQDGDYGYLVSGYYDSGMDYYEKKHDRESAALAAYADAALQYRAWSEGGMSAKAEEAKKRMEEAEKNVGVYAYELPAVRKKAGLE